MKMMFLDVATLVHAACHSLYEYRTKCQSRKSCQPNTGEASGSTDNMQENNGIY